jgi:ACS family tartrate transporter-like MFS transporter
MIFVSRFEWAQTTATGEAVKAKLAWPWFTLTGTAVTIAMRGWREPFCRRPIVSDEATIRSSAIALDRARQKAYWHLLPLLFVCYVIAYVDRSNVAIAKLTMTRDLPGFNNAVIGFGAGVFFVGYFLLEIPGTLIVEKWSARSGSAGLIPGGIMAALTGGENTVPIYRAFPARLAEAGFFPGHRYLTHWFPTRPAGAGLLLRGTPIAQVVSPKISNALLKIEQTKCNGWLSTTRSC